MSVFSAPRARPLVQAIGGMEIVTSAQPLYCKPIAGSLIAVMMLRLNVLKNSMIRSSFTAATRLWIARMCVPRVWTRPRPLQMLSVC